MSQIAAFGRALCALSAIWPVATAAAPVPGGVALPDNPKLRARQCFHAAAVQSQRAGTVEAYLVGNYFMYLAARDYLGAPVTDQTLAQIQTGTTQAELEASFPLFSACLSAYPVSHAVTARLPTDPIGRYFVCYANNSTMLSGMRGIVALGVYPEAERAKAMALLNRVATLGARMSHSPPVLSPDAYVAAVAQGATGLPDAGSGAAVLTACERDLVLEPPSKVLFDIPAGDAAKSLAAWSSASGLKVAYSEGALTGLSTRAVKGTMNVRDALDTMLADTRIAITVDNGSTITVAVVGGR